MADKTLKSITFPGLPDRYVVPDNSADIEQIKEDLSLLYGLIPNTTQVVTRDGGRITQIQHKQGDAIVRTDAFAYSAEEITEARSLDNGASLTITTDLKTLQTTATYTEV